MFHGDFNLKKLKYNDLKDNALNKRDKVVEALKEIDEDFYLGKRDYSLKSNKDKQKTLKKMRENDKNSNHY